MTDWKRRTCSAALAACLLLGTATPALAAPAQAEPTGFVETLMEIPVLGDLVRLLTGGGQRGDATPETATPETATPETATPESATPETAPTPLPGTPAPTAAPGQTTPAPSIPLWPAGWMTGAPVPGARYPAGNAQTEARTNATLWGPVALSNGTTLQAASREETNLGDLAADAAALAAASSDAWNRSGNTLPLVAVLDGASLTGTVEAGVDLNTVAQAVRDDTLALVVIDGAKLRDLLNVSLEGMLDSQSSGYGGYPQVSGLRFTWKSAGGEPQVDSLWLADSASADGRAVTADTRLALVLPAGLLERFGLNTAENLLADSGLTLRGAITSLPANADADTLTVLLSRQGSVGRSLPVNAGSYTGTVCLGTGYANHTIHFLLDGTPMTAVADVSGNLWLEYLTPGSHTFRMQAGEPGYYLSNITFIGTADGTPVMVSSVPAASDGGVVVQPTATPQPVVTAAPAAPQANSAETRQEEPSQTVTATQTPAAAAVQPTAAPAARQQTKSTRTPAPVQDPSAGTLIGTTPMPTLEPTEAPEPTAEPTPDPEETERREEAAQTSSKLPLYTAIVLGLVCVAVVAVLLIRRGTAGGQSGESYHRRKNRK